MEAVMDITAQRVTSQEWQAQGKQPAGTHGAGSGCAAISYWKHLVESVDLALQLFWKLWVTTGLPKEAKHPPLLPWHTARICNFRLPSTGRLLTNYFGRSGRVQVGKTKQVSVRTLRTESTPTTRKSYVQTHFDTDPRTHLRMRGQDGCTGNNDR